MKVSLPPHKLQKSMFLIEQAIEMGKKGQSMSCRSLAQVTGHLAHASISHGAFSKIISRIVFIMDTNYLNF